MKETQRIAILTDLFVGFRVGELLALEIADLDLERQTLRINKNLIRVKTEALSLDFELRPKEENTSDRSKYAQDKDIEPRDRYFGRLVRAVDPTSLHACSLQLAQSR